jgi:hypothetical protein
LIISSSSNYYYFSGIPLNLGYPTPKPGFFITKSGSSSYYFITLEAMSQLLILYAPGAGTIFLLSKPDLLVPDFNEDNPYFYWVNG